PGPRLTMTQARVVCGIAKAFLTKASLRASMAGLGLPRQLIRTFTSPLLLLFLTLSPPLRPQRPQPASGPWRNPAAGEPAAGASPAAHRRAGPTGDAPDRPSGSSGPGTPSGPRSPGGSRRS